MLHTIFKTTLVTAGLVLAGLANAQNVAIVNGKAIPSGMLDYIMAEQAKRGAPDSPEMRATVREKMVSQEILSQEAAKKGLGRSDQVKYQTKLAQQAILAEALRQDFFSNQAIDDAEMQAAYDNISKMMSGSEYRASHILVEDEGEAKKLIKELDGGADFAALAKKHSKDPGSGANGGDLDWANPQAFVPEFSEAMVALEKGKYTKEPVQSQFGYHIILLTDVREMAPPPLDQISDQLRERMLSQKWEEYVQALTEKADIK